MKSSNQLFKVYPPTILLYVFSVFFFALAIQTVQAQVVFGVKPGFGVTMSYIGLQKGRLTFLGGLEYIGGSVAETESGGPQGIYERRAKVDVFIPSLGLKYFLHENKDLKFYLTGVVLKPIVTGSDEENGSKNEGFERFIDSLNLWGLNVGYGAEYFFSEQFSIGGEVGFRAFWLNRTERIDNFTSFVFNPDTGEYQEVTYQRKYEHDIDLRFTYTAITLTFYF